MVATTMLTPTKWPSRLPASMALQDGVKKANPVLLEPIMKVVVVTPEEFMGDVIGDLNSKRGRIESMEDLALALKKSPLLYHLVKCLVTPPTFVATPRAAPAQAWSLTTTLMFQATLPRLLLPRTLSSAAACRQQNAPLRRGRFEYDCIFGKRKAL